MIYKKNFFNNLGYKNNFWIKNLHFKPPAGIFCKFLIQNFLYAKLLKKFKLELYTKTFTDLLVDTFDMKPNNNSYSTKDAIANQFHSEVNLPLESKEKPNNYGTYGSKTENAFKNATNTMQRAKDHNFSDIFNTAKGSGGSRSNHENLKNVPGGQQYYVNSTKDYGQRGSTSDAFKVSSDNT